MRLQSFLSKSGISSRRKAAEIIQNGLVKVDGEVVLEPGRAIDPKSNKISFKNKTIKFEEKMYFVFHKPKNVITTNKDTHGRKIVADYFKKVGGRVYPVGRLDRNTSGLLIVTNDGDLSNLLLHPRYKVVKRYAVVTDKQLTGKQMDKFRKGLLVDKKKTTASQIEYYGEVDGGYAYEVSLKEGRNRQIRKMMEILGKSVKDLHRFEFGPIELGKLRVGEYRKLSSKEVEELKGGAL